MKSLPSSINESEQEALLNRLASATSESDVLDAIKAGINLDAQDKLGRTALILAIERLNLKAVSALLAARASVGIPDNFGNTPLIHAAQRNNSEAVSALLAVGANANEKNRYNKTALMFAAEGGCSNAALALIPVVADIDAIDTDRKTALMYAAGEKGNQDVVSTLIKKGANVTLTDKMGRTALSIANEANVGKSIISPLTDANIALLANGKSITPTFGAFKEVRIAEKLIRAITATGQDIKVEFSNKEKYASSEMYRLPSEDTSDEEEKSALALKSALIEGGLSETKANVVMMLSLQKNYWEDGSIGKCYLSYIAKEISNLVECLEKPLSSEKIKKELKQLPLPTILSEEDTNRRVYAFLFRKKFPELTNPFLTAESVTSAAALETPLAASGEIPHPLSSTTTADRAAGGPEKNLEEQNSEASVYLTMEKLIRNMFALLKKPSTSPSPTGAEAAASGRSGVKGK